MKQGLSRRTFLISSATVGLSAGAASANIFSDVWDAVSGHAEDAAGRVFGDDEFIGGEVVKTGTFDETAVGQDAAHWATGTVEVRIKDAKLYIQLVDDFNSGPLPDGYVYFSSTTDINDEADFNGSKQIEAGKLKLGKGASFYELPADVKLENVRSVTVWCKRFGEYIGSADLK